MTATISYPDSGDPDVDALLLFGVRWNERVLTYSFPVDSSGYKYTQSPYEYESAFAPLPGGAKDAVRTALETYASFINIDFVEVAGPSDLRFAIAGIDSGGRGWDPGSPEERSGDVYLPSTTNWDRVSIETVKYYTILHEIGHALGLSHVGASLSPDKESIQFTVMSYPSWPGQDPLARPIDTPSTPMQLDIAALQYLYGANFNHNSGDTTYSWNASTGDMFIDGVQVTTPERAEVFMTLWDGGGKDTFDLSNFFGVKVDLRPGEWTLLSESLRPTLTFNDPDVGSNDANGNIANPYLYKGDTRSLIENAIGGRGDDRFIGNQANNEFRGGEGDDTFFYTGGIDTFIGGSKRDDGDTADFSMVSARLIFKPVQTFVTFTINGTVIRSPIQADTSLADTNGNSYEVVLSNGFRLATLTGIENLIGSKSDDDITGDGSSNEIDAEAGNDIVRYLGGFDYMRGGTGVDELNFAQYRSAVSLQLSSDDRFYADVLTSDTSSWDVGTLRVISRAASFENVVGSAFDDRLFGNSGANVLDGGGGGDDLYGRGGNDIYIVNSTADRVFESHPSFSFFDEGGVDEVRSSVTFTLGNFVENLTLTGTSSLTGRGNSLDNELTGNSGSNTLYGLGGDDSLDGQVGNDRMYGGDGNDRYIFAGSKQGSDYISDSGGTDTLVLSSFSQISSIVRSGSDLVLSLSYGSVRIAGHFSGNSIEFVSDAGRKVVLATGLIGGAPSGIITGTNKSDFMDGGGGDDLLYGNNGNDTLLGSEGDDLLDGGNGRDFLDGGVGDDILTGGRGRDVFVFREGYGHDEVSDFDLRLDTLDISGFIDAPSASLNAAGVLLEFGGGDSLQLNVQIGSKGHWSSAGSAQLSAWVDSFLDDFV